MGAFGNQERRLSPARKRSCVSSFFGSSISPRSCKSVFDHIDKDLQGQLPHSATSV